MFCKTVHRFGEPPEIGAGYKAIIVNSVLQKITYLLYCCYYYKFHIMELTKITASLTNTVKRYYKNLWL